MQVSDYCKKIHELDRLLVDLLNERAKAAQEIGRLKHTARMSVCEPAREKLVLENVSRANQGPLSDAEVRYVYRGIIDVMRGVQRIDIQPLNSCITVATESEVEQ